MSLIDWNASAHKQIKPKNHFKTINNTDVMHYTSNCKKVIPFFDCVQFTICTIYASVVIKEI